MMRQSVLERPKKALVDEELSKEDEAITFEPSKEVQDILFLSIFTFDSFI